MTDEDLATRYAVLRAAAAEVVHSALLSEYPAPYTPERPTSTEHGSMHVPGAVDPRRHSLAFTHYREDGTSEPYDLERLGAEIRAELDADRIRGEHVPDHPVRDVQLTDARAMCMASLLKELTKRLNPGPAMGTAESGRALAAVAEECSKRLENLAGLGD